MSAPPNLLLLRLARRWKLILLLSVLSTALAAVAERFDLFELGDAERGAYDSGLKAFTFIDKPDDERGLSERLFGFLKKKPKKSSQVVVVAIDDYTFAEVSRVPLFRADYGAWPYSRNVWAHLLRELRSLGARAVILDAAMDEPHTDPTGDIALAQTVSELGMPFYVGVTMTADQRVAPLPAVKAQNLLPGELDGGVPLDVKVSEDDPFGEAQEAGAGAVVRLSDEDAALRLAFPVVTGGGYELPLLHSSGQERARGGKALKSPIRPIDPLLHTLPGFGVVEPEADEDGKLRRTWFVYGDGRNTYVSLSVAAVADLLGAARVEVAPGELRIGERRVRINPRGDAEINYGGTLADRFHVISMAHLLHDHRGAQAAAEAGKPFQKQLRREWFEGKVAIIGGFAVGTADSKPTPLEPGTPAVVKHAAELDSLLGGRFIVEAPYWVSLLIALFVALFSAALIMVVRSTALEVVWPVGLFFGFFLVTGALLVYTDTHVLSAMPGLAGSVASVIATAINHLFADKQTEHTRKMLSRYMEPQLVEQMVEKGEQPVLGGENREVTAFFSDIRGFSGFTERWRDDPQKLVKFLNQYLTRVTQVLFDNQGCVDKYIGDAVVCLFGAPFVDAQHARHGCEAALAVRDEIDRMREEFRQQGLPDVYTRIGVNTDVMFVGNFGSEQIFDYTAMGDGMNLAARLEGANKSYDSVIMVGENTYRKVKDHFEFRELDRVRVAGKQQPVAVYELLARAGRLDPKKQQVVRHYHEALSRYRLALFHEAQEHLEAALALDPEDGPSKALGRRCQKYVEHPPAMPFDGISNLEK